MDIRKYFKPINGKEVPESSRLEEGRITKHVLDEESWMEQGRLPKALEYDFNKLWLLHPEEFGLVRIVGKYVKTPRWQQTYLKPYWFSGMVHEPLQLPKEIEPFLKWANTLYKEWSFNQVLINWYLDGRHYIGPHSDAEHQIVKGSPIVSISLGQERTFRVRDKANNSSIVLDLPMPSDTYVSMCGKMQEKYLHEVPKVDGTKGSKMDRRINITFRVFKD